MGQQVSKRFRYRSRGPGFTFAKQQRVLRQTVNDDELGPRAVRRFAAPESYETLDDITTQINTMLDGNLRTTDASDLGATLLRFSELSKIIKEPASRLGRFSYEVALSVCRDQLPDSAQEATRVELGRLILAGSVGGKRMIVATLEDAGTIMSERTCLTESISEYERAQLSFLPLQPHITLGHIRSRDMQPGYFKRLREVGSHINECVVRLAPVE